MVGESWYQRDLEVLRDEKRWVWNATENKIDRRHKETIVAENLKPED